MYNPDSFRELYQSPHFYHPQILEEFQDDVVFL